MEKPQLFVDGAGAEDFSQGDLGNCWFVAACASIANKPEIWKKVHIFGHSHSIGLNLDCYKNVTNVDLLTWAILKLILGLNRLCLIMKNKTSVVNMQGFSISIFITLEHG